MKKHIILDCDGVIYPTHELSLKSILTALKTTANQFKISDHTWITTKKKYKNSRQQGMVNFMNNLCRENNIDFNFFTKAHASNLDYRKISINAELTNLINQFVKNGDSVTIASNNHYHHIKQVLYSVFANPDIINKINIYDGTTFEENDMFIVKPSEYYYRNLIKSLKIYNATRAFYLDDSSRNINESQKHGVQSYLINSEQSTVSALIKIIEK